ncbi:MAG TPA: hypothetical protein GX708_05345, partial [Gallicola sp.]|nr:hypothetical protein [Gallicola sp.]
MKIIGVGDLVTDFYYENDKLIGLDGGMTSHNIIVNLAHLKYNTKVIGARGDDTAGKLAEDSLKSLNVDISNINIVDYATRCFHVSFVKIKGKYSFTSKKRCPVCQEKKWYDGSKLDIDKTIKNINKEDIVIFDNLNDINIKIIEKLNNNIIMLDLGQYFEFENLSDQELLDKLNYNYTIIQLNNRVSNYLLKRYNINENELFTIIKSKLIVITKGENGGNFYYNDKLVNVRPSKIIEETDPTGAGDAHFA